MDMTLYADVYHFYDLGKRARNINYKLYRFDQDFSALIIEMGKSLKYNSKLRSHLISKGWSEDQLNTLVKTTTNNPPDFNYEGILELLSML